MPNIQLVILVSVAHPESKKDPSPALQGQDDSEWG